MAVLYKAVQLIQMTKKLMAFLLPWSARPAQTGQEQTKNNYLIWMRHYLSLLLRFNKYALFYITPQTTKRTKVECNFHP